MVNPREIDSDSLISRNGNYGDIFCPEIQYEKFDDIPCLVYTS